MRVTIFEAMNLGGANQRLWFIVDGLKDASWILGRFRGIGR
jgi:hypothetical protein